MVKGNLIPPRSGDPTTGCLLWSIPRTHDLLLLDLVYREVSPFPQGSHSVVLLQAGFVSLDSGSWNPTSDTKKCDAYGCLSECQCHMYECLL